MKRPNLPRQAAAESADVRQLRRPRRFQRQDAALSVEDDSHAARAVVRSHVDAGLADDQGAVRRSWASSASRRSSADGSSISTASASVAMRYTPEKPGDEAGIIAFQNDDHFYLLAVANDDGAPVVRLERSVIGGAEGRDRGRGVGATRRRARRDDVSQDSGARRPMYDFYYGRAPDTWTLLAKDVDGTILSTKKAGGFVGTTVRHVRTRWSRSCGIAVASNGSGTAICRTARASTRSRSPALADAASVHHVRRHHRLARRAGSRRNARRRRARLRFARRLPRRRAFLRRARRTIRQSNRQGRISPSTAASTTWRSTIRRIISTAARTAFIARCGAAIRSSHGTDVGALLTHVARPRMTDIPGSLNVRVGYTRDRRQRARSSTTPRRRMPRRRRPSRSTRTSISPATIAAMCSTTS